MEALAAQEPAARSAQGGRCRRQLARQVAIAAVVIERCQLAFLVGLFGQLLGLRHMVMAMVAEMRGMRRLVLAIRSSRRPGILEWQTQTAAG